MKITRKTISFATFTTLVAVVFVFSALAINADTFNVLLDQTPLPSQTSESAGALTQTPETAATDNWRQYVDLSLNFSVEYPPDWFIYPAPVQGVAKTTILSSFDLEMAPGIEAAPDADQLRVSISVSPNLLTDVQNPTQWIIDNYLPIEAADVTSSEIEVSGLQGTRIDFSIHDAREAYIYVPWGDNLLFIDVIPMNSDTSDIIEKILSTIVLH